MWLVYSKVVVFVSAIVAGEVVQLAASYLETPTPFQKQVLRTA